VFTAATFIKGVPADFPGPPGAFLDAAKQFVFLALDELQFVVRKPGKFLFQLAPDNVPISLGGKHAHKMFPFGYLLPPRNLTRHGFLSQFACRPIAGPIFPASPSICRPPNFRRKKEWPGLLQTAISRLASCIISVGQGPGPSAENAGAPMEIAKESPWHGAS
jgi:hypothetical protein